MLKERQDAAGWPSLDSNCRHPAAGLHVMPACPFPNLPGPMPHRCSGDAAVAAVEHGRPAARAWLCDGRQRGKC